MDNIGFTSSETSAGLSTTPYLHKVREGYSIKTLGAALSILVVLGGLVWGAAMLSAGKATDDDMSGIEVRLRSVESHDSAQTAILDNIKDKLGSIKTDIRDLGHKIDRAHSK